ncbi:hypothetical protein K491DRAFT_716952 [Lophiostoma macrostomum CBS 122681]|uniref:Uncharacterized protein n=1 Tax=Lophiostoma macrostomum CBS 122681 TaxID=1314788 RepID=A0A6A6T5Y7_9PLEO|nr:hypothetical protein K491DRAFT_716952 [Lophiostoma macrostomum CBS 122681]
MSRLPGARDIPAENPRRNLLGTFLLGELPTGIEWICVAPPHEHLISRRIWGVETFLTWEDANGARHTIEYVTIEFPVHVYQTPSRFDFEFVFEPDTSRSWSFQLPERAMLPVRQECITHELELLLMFRDSFAGTVALDPGSTCIRVPPTPSP